MRESSFRRRGPETLEATLEYVPDVLLVPPDQSQFSSKEELMTMAELDNMLNEIE